jgi:hypothetical protein
MDVETFAIIEQQAASRKEKKTQQGCSSSIFNQIHLFLQSL